MKKFTSITLLCIAVASLLANTFSSFSLCGGTLMQRLLRMSSCTETQEKFMGFRGLYFFYESEFVGATLLFIVASTLIAVVFFKMRSGGK